MLVKRTNIENRLRRQRDLDLKGDDILRQVERVFEEDRFRESAIINKLSGKDLSVANNFKFDLLESNRIFHIDQIRETCIRYRLRFLDTKYFKGKYPQAAVAEIKYLENVHETALDGFKIIAPSKMFVLEKSDDPLLFAPMGNDYYYLVHKWGNDLHPLRRWLMWPYKSFENLIFAVFLVSMVATFLIPDGLFAKEQSFSQDVMVFFFMFKSIAAVVIYYGFAAGKNFNPAIWNNKFDKT
ncbi:hypothetical protein EAX61_11150 [Dokdonia sinensis]|uniref:Uncharacterized protein n=1 Tax=Dokdonia sinensis TaxID=2479847 RepID=A0A3M0FY78_9FLAO|nr:hypothetical protein [Dokdonia sinensis]RMB57661.1 hypothetical protein EAX61_11150 [Dokdonia sinensis]